MEKRVAIFDLLRVGALSLVIFQHIVDRFVFQNPDSILWSNSFGIITIITLYQFARIAVPLFILLSGSLLLTQYKEGSVLEFYKKRWNRIGFLSLAAFACYFFWQSWWFSEPVTLKSVFRDFFFMDTGHLYFLQIIIVLYAITPLLVRFRVFQSKMLVGMALILAVLATGIAFSRNEWWVWYRSLPLYPLIFISLYIAGGYMYYKRISLKPNLLYWSVCVLLAGIASLSLFGTVVEGVSGPAYAVSVFSIPILLLSLLVYAGALSYANLATSQRYLIAIAEWSFVLYLVHPFVLDVLQRLLV